MSSTSYRYCRVPPSCNAQFVANKLLGQPLHSLTGGRAVVPLLHPQHHGLPFALTLELHTSPAIAAQRAAGATAPPRTAPGAALDRSLYELHYVLGGSGQLVRPGSTEDLQAGDAVLMHAGAAACSAAAATPDCGASSSSTADAGGEAPFAMAELVFHMPRRLFEQQRQQQEQREEQQHCEQLMLQSASLGPLLQQQQQPGSAAAEAGHLSEAYLDALLAGARETARQALLGCSPAFDDDGEQQQTEQQHGAQPSSSSSSSSWFQMPSAMQAAVAGLQAWWQQQVQQGTCPVTKRSLAELTAFRLPNQSNRLAVQFDPYSRPQVPFISAVEVFEPGHRTTPHVHPHAHELFFILAGEGHAFCGEQRFPVAAGDVVVFRPGSVHGIDNGTALGRMYCLEVMLPNEQFAEFVRSGTDTGQLGQDDLCVLASVGCR